MELLLDTLDPAITNAKENNNNNVQPYIEDWIFVSKSHYFVFNSDLVSAVISLSFEFSFVPLISNADFI